MTTRDADTTGGEGSSEPSRRNFMIGAIGALTAGAAGTAHAMPPPKVEVPLLGEPGSLAVSNRGRDAYQRRVRAARYLLEAPPVQANNGDEERYGNRLANYSKGLPHNALGEVDPAAYDALLRAVRSGRPEDFEAIPRGGSLRATSPQAGYAFTMEGLDPQYSVAPPAPEFASAEQAAEMVEVYWQALTRDVPFNEYGSNPLTWAAAEDLSRLSDFRGPKSNGVVIPEYLFRGLWDGDLAGPYVSQFLWQDIPLGATRVVQKMRCPEPGVDFNVAYSEWLGLQNGAAPARAASFDPVHRYIRSGRDLGEWVHLDHPYLSGHNALLILKSFGEAALDPGNPLRSSPSQLGFVTFGPPDCLDLMARVANLSMKATWYQKWGVHRRLRPEVFAGRVHNNLRSGTNYPVHGEVFSSRAVEVLAGRGSFLLPLAFPEGSPSHPSYTAGHATFAAATVTILKAVFDEEFVIPNPVVASSDGTELLPWEGGALTVGGELNKLASNIAIARNTAGVHWRTDAVASARLGERIAIELLRDYARQYNESFPGFRLKTFDGVPLVIR